MERRSGSPLARAFATRDNTAIHAQRECVHCHRHIVAPVCTVHTRYLRHCTPCVSLQRGSSYIKITRSFRPSERNRFPICRQHRGRAQSQLGAVYCRCVVWVSIILCVKRQWTDDNRTERVRKRCDRRPNEQNRYAIPRERASETSEKMASPCNVI